MSRLMIALCCGMLAASPPVLGKDDATADGKRSARKAPTEKQLAHQRKMKDCSRQAGERKLKGDERKRFMSACLKA
jgi:psiF repeat